MYGRRANCAAVGWGKRGVMDERRLLDSRSAQCVKTGVEEWQVKRYALWEPRRKRGAATEDHFTHSMRGGCAADALP